MKTTANEPKLKEDLIHPDRGAPSEFLSSDATDNGTPSGFTDEDIADIDEDIMMYMINV